MTAALFALAGVCDGPLLTATLRIRAQYAPDGVRTQVFTLGAGLKVTAASTGAALVGIVAYAPAAALLTGIAGLLLASALLHALTAVREPGRPGRPVRAGATEPSAGSATTAAGPRTPEGP